VGKYDPLRDYLASRSGSEVRMTFAEVEQLVGPLPDSAHNYRAWWANDNKVEALAWRAAGWRVESVNQASGHVVFARGATGGASRSGHIATASRASYIDSQVRAAIQAQEATDRFDRAKLLRLIDELNDNYVRGNAYAAHALLRTVLDHVPPLLGCADFAAVANNYPWGRTDKGYMALRS
jgi:hypothetical protein